MKVSIEMITPDVARELLKSNIDNRKEKNRHVSYLAKIMEEGNWRENGEAIIIGSDGVLKDGQHRLRACIIANYSYKAVIVRGVEPMVMDTIDTGINRSLSDVLQLNGFTYYSSLAGMIKIILRYNKGGGLEAGGGQYGLTNRVGLEYATKHKDLLAHYIADSAGIWERGSKPIGIAMCGFIAYVIAKGHRLEKPHIDFLKELLGVTKTEGSSASYVNRVLIKNKESKTPINAMWRLGLIIKAWNNFNQGDPAVKWLKYDLKNKLPKVF